MRVAAVLVSVPVEKKIAFEAIAENKIDFHYLGEVTHKKTFVVDEEELMSLEEAKALFEGALPLMMGSK